jgi:hypothetical protein
MKHLINERRVFGFAVQRTTALFILITLVILALPPSPPGSQALIGKTLQQRQQHDRAE